MKDFGLAGESIVCFAGEDWWYHHPHIENRLMRRLAGRNKILFVNSITMGLPSVSNPDFFLKVKRKLRSYRKWLKKVPEGLWVMTPISLPLYGSRFGRWINRSLLVLQLRFVMLLLGMRQPVVLACIPTAVDVVCRLGGEVLLYQVCDKVEANEDSALSPHVIHELDHKMKEMADIVIYNGKRLFDEAMESNRYYLPVGVDYDLFANLPGEPAPDAADLPRPLLGYFGAMDFMMDTELIADVAHRRPDWHWMLIGNRSNVIRLSGTNLHFLGPRPLTDLPKYVTRFDVCVLPWRADNRFASYGSAMKVREYMATGKPVVIAPLYEYLNTPGIRIYRSVDEFVALVEDSLKNDSPKAATERQAVVRNGTWDDRARELCNLICSIREYKRYEY